MLLVNHSIISNSWPKNRHQEWGFFSICSFSYYKRIVASSYFVFYWPLFDCLSFFQMSSFSQIILPSHYFFRIALDSLLVFPVNSLILFHVVLNYFILVVQFILNNLLQHYISKTSVFLYLKFLMVVLSQPCIKTGKIVCLDGSHFCCHCDAFAH